MRALPFYLHLQMHPVSLEANKPHQYLIKKIFANFR